MSTTEIALPSAARTADWIGQATAVEQARAVAEVQAAIIVAQQCPRDMQRATAEMADSCGRMSLAQKAFYTVPNRGHGPSVHLARELARIWGNLDYGVKELRRDDDAGVSEVMAYAWDCQTNVRSVRTFIAPHARMKGKARQALVDLNDIYLSNQNTGARAVRECLFTVMPTWLTEEAQDICRRTLEHGDGKPLAQRISDMIAAFKGINVTVEQMESKLGRKRGQWTAGDVASMVISFTSITRDGLSKDDEFPPPRVTADDILGPQPPAEPEPTEPPAEPAPELMRDNQRRKMFALFNDIGMKDHGQRLAMVGDIVGREVSTTSDLNVGEADKVITYLSETP